jgi:hypothetical protein
MPEPERSGFYCSAICRYSRTLLNIELARDQRGAPLRRPPRVLANLDLLASARLEPPVLTQIFSESLWWKVVGYPYDDCRSTGIAARRFDEPY